MLLLIESVDVDSRVELGDVALLDVCWTSVLLLIEPVDVDTRDEDDDVDVDMLDSSVVDSELDDELVVDIVIEPIVAELLAKLVVESSDVVAVLELVKLDCSMLD